MFYFIDGYDFLFGGIYRNGLGLCGVDHRLFPSGFYGEVSEVFPSVDVNVYLQLA